jgi:hypothetical protein
MKLATKNIQVGLNSVKANLSQITIQDLNKFNNMFYEYKYDDVDETLIIGKYFDLDYIEDDYAYFNITDKMMRKAKLLTLFDSELSKSLIKILSNSVYCSLTDVLEKKLSRELAKEINLNIINDLLKLKK